MNENKVPGSLDRVLLSIDLDGYKEGRRSKQKAPDDGSPNVATSLLRSGLHAPVIDIDIPVTLVPSSTPGHSHLYIDKAMDFSSLCHLLRAMAAAGVVEVGFAEASIAKGYSAVRLPWVKKP